MQAVVICMIRFFVMRMPKLACAALGAPAVAIRRHCQGLATLLSFYDRAFGD